MAKIGRVLSILSFWLSPVCCIFLVNATQAAPQVSASVDRKVMGVSDTFTLSVAVSSQDAIEVSEPQMPTLEGFEILNKWTGMESRASFVTNAKGQQEFQTTRTHRFNFVLAPKKMGQLRIDEIAVEVGGRTIRTSPITVTVTNAKPQDPTQQRAQRPGLPPGFDPFTDDVDDLFSQLLQRHGMGRQGQQLSERELADAFFIRAELDKTKAYLGEQITSSWFLYTRVGVRDLDTLKYPTLKGFWKEDLEVATRLNFGQEIINGIAYNKALLVSYALFPLKAGVSIIDPYQAKLTVVANGQIATQTKQSQELKIEVNELPMQGKPADFSGAVGDLNIISRLDGNEFFAGQPFSLRVRVEGRGNVKSIETPVVQWPPGIEVYDQRSEAKFFRNGTSYKEFELILLSRVEGAMVLPAIQLNYFDPSTHRYMSKATQPINIQFQPPKPGTQMPSQRLGQVPGQAKENFVPQLFSTADTWGMSAHLQFGLWGIVSGLLTLILLFKARNELQWGKRDQDILADAHRRFKKVYQLNDQGKWRHAGIETINAVYAILGEVSGIGGAHQELKKLFAESPPSVRRDLSEPVTRLMEKFQLIGFAPENVVGELKEKNKLYPLIKEMEGLMAKAIKLARRKDKAIQTQAPS